FVDRDQVGALAREFDLAEIRVGAEEAQPLLSFAREDFAAVFEIRAFLDERLEVADIKSRALIAIVFRAACFREALLHELVDPTRREVQDRGEIFDPHDSRVFFFLFRTRRPPESARVCECDDLRGNWQALRGHAGAYLLPRRTLFALFTDKQRK